MMSTRDDTATLPAWMKSAVNVEALGQNLYRSTENLWTLKGARGAFGGQVVAQALMAALKSVDDPDFLMHSMHSYYLNPTKPTVAVTYKVDRSKDGRNICSRSVTALQEDRAVFHCLASFSKARAQEFDVNHTWSSMPDVPFPGTEVPDDSDYVLKDFQEYTAQRRFPVSVYACFYRDLFKNIGKIEPRLMLWMKGKGGPIQGDPQNLHRIALSCFSDFLMPSPIFMKFPQLRRNHSLIASLDHSIWFHAPVHVDQWHLFVQDCDRAVGENALTICRIFNADGTQVATCTQESLKALNYSKGCSNENLSLPCTLDCRVFRMITFIMRECSVSPIYNFG